MTGGYSVLAKVYDRLNGSVDYEAFADYMEMCFERYLVSKPELVLDMGCGTGSVTLPLARRGYDMTGLDISPEMLSQAYTRAADEGLNGIMFLEGDMCDFELYGTVGAVVCCLDGINHLLEADDVKRCFALVHNYLDPDGLFVFDVNTPYKFRHVYADNDYVLEEDGALCAWRNRLSDDGEQVDFHLTVFEKGRTGLYRRRDGVQSERCYSNTALREMLTEAGFEVIGIFEALSFDEPAETSERWHVVARAKKNV
ncbi:MAG: class I SAM-dependent methyltransferase [Clostridia bacterium]|nr:class I SAM-dependent methyltransferase [Clostridia bacterium]